MIHANFNEIVDKSFSSINEQNISKVLNLFEELYEYYRKYNFNEIPEFSKFIKNYFRSNYQLKESTLDWIDDYFARDFNNYVLSHNLDYYNKMDESKKSKILSGIVPDESPIKANTTGICFDDMDAFVTNLIVNNIDNISPAIRNFINRI